MARNSKKLYAITAIVQLSAKRIYSPYDKNYLSVSIIEAIPLFFLKTLAL